MRAHERRFIRRLMIVASVLVALMLGAMFYSALQGTGRAPAQGPRDPTTSSSPAPSRE